MIDSAGFSQDSDVTQSETGNSIALCIIIFAKKSSEPKFAEPRMSAHSPANFSHVSGL